MTEIEFSTFKFHDGLNYTVRLGCEGWGTLKSGDKIKLVPKDKRSKKSYTASIDTMRVSCFSKIADEVLEYEQDPKRRDLKGLEKALQKVYKTKDSLSDRTVLSIGFIISDDE
jgi:hypothetical protein